MSLVKPYTQKIIKWWKIIRTKVVSSYKSKWNNIKKKQSRIFIFVFLIIAILTIPKYVSTIDWRMNIVRNIYNTPNNVSGMAKMK
jgi:hypothetical protein